MKEKKIFSNALDALTIESFRRIIIHVFQFPWSSSVYSTGTVLFLSFFLSTDPFSRPKFHQARRDDRVCSRVTDLRFPTISDKVRARADKKGERGTWQRISRRRMGQSRNFTSNRGLHPPPRPLSRAAAPATILRTRNVLWFLPSLPVSAPAAHPKNTRPFQGIFR